ncbi:MAG: hypothetical protein KA886_00245 [Candidatus Cloacimonetes bacterium]|nr:hypothetical protein [Candidatus Cloacimonadota bacterium]HPM02299.1 hypothetical protein [Candidatus Cloacimonadota bacterium]
MKRLSFIILLISLSLICQAEELSNIQAAFLDIGFGARAMGMGGAQTAISKNAGSLVWNPASATQSNYDNAICFDNVNIQDLYSYSYFGFTHKTKSNNAFGLGFIHSGDEAMSETTVILSSALSKEFIRNYTRFAFFDLGLNAKLLISSFGNNSEGAYFDPVSGLNHQVSGNATGFAMDLAMHMKLGDFDHFGLILKNPVSIISWNSENEVGTAKGKYSEGLPATLVFGFGREADKYSFALDLDKSIHSDTEDIFKLGTEYHLFKELMSIRGGYSQELLTGNNKRYSIGTGFNIKPSGKYKVSLDLAYQIETNWENHNTLRISCDFLM